MSKLLQDVCNNAAGVGFISGWGRLQQATTTYNPNRSTAPTTATTLQVVIERPYPLFSFFLNMISETYYISWRASRLVLRNLVQRGNVLSASRLCPYRHLGCSRSLFALLFSALMCLGIYNIMKGSGRARGLSTNILE